MSLTAASVERNDSRSPLDAAVRLAAIEAADEDPLFQSDLVTERAAALFVAIQRAWSADDPRALSRLVGDELMVVGY